MFKKLALALLSCAAISAYAKMTPTKQQTEQLYQAVEQSLPTSVMLRMNLLYLAQGYAYQDVDDISALPLEEIKVYQVLSPKITQCITHELNKKTYQKSLQEGIRHYFNQVTPDDFKRDLAYLGDPKRVTYFNYAEQHMELLAKHADVLEEYFKTGVETEKNQIGFWANRSI